MKQNHLLSILIIAPLMSLTPSPANAEANLDALRSQAASGDVNAQRTLAFRYRDGTGMPKADAEALHWAHRAADGGDAEAMDFIGFAYLRGSAIKGNPVVAFGYLRQRQIQVGAHQSRPDARALRADERERVLPHETPKNRKAAE